MGNNVLGELFQDIAEAIRDKTGGTETMKQVLEKPKQTRTL